MPKLQTLCSNVELTRDDFINDVHVLLHVLDLNKRCAICPAHWSDVKHLCTVSDRTLPQGMPLTPIIKRKTKGPNKGRLYLEYLQCSVAERWLQARRS